MEAAIGETGLLWSSVQPAVAQDTRACVDDRAGLGWSDPSPRPRTAAVMVQELLRVPPQLPGLSSQGRLVIDAIAEVVTAARTRATPGSADPAAGPNTAKEGLR
jgi:hypothetical protein